MFFSVGLSLILIIFSANASDLWIIRLENNNVVTDNSNPRLGWHLLSIAVKQNTSQTAYQILVASNSALLKSENPDLWDTGKVYSDQNWNIKYEGEPAKPGQIVYWAVRAWDQNDNATEYTQGFWRQEFDISQWRAKWIGSPKELKEQAFKDIQNTDKEVIKTHPGLKPVLYFRKTFNIKEQAERAYIYCSAKGLFKGYLSEPYGLFNGNVQPLLEPGWTNYNKTIQYHTFDVTFTINSYSEHTIGFIVAPGWYSGYVGPDNYNAYGKEESLLFELHMHYSNGTKKVITSDETWKVTTGGIVYSDLMHGEVFYENCELYNWLEYDYNDSAWFQPVTERFDKNVALVSDFTPISTLPLVFCDDYWNIDTNVWVYEFPKIVTGRIDISIGNFTDSTRIQIRYAEAVYPNGSIYTGNHKTALDTDVFLLNGVENRPELLYITPFFSYHSFKYVEITGLVHPLNIHNQIHGVDFVQAHANSNFGSSNIYVQALLSMIQSSYSGNILSIPTNTPSRDTRLGWLEPVGLNSLSDMYFSGDFKSYKKWLRDIREAQASSGAFSNVAPKVVDEDDASPGSGTAPIIITYNIYRMFADIETVEENYASNKKWLKYVRFSNPNYLFINNVGKNEGDIGNVNAETPKEIISTAYFAYGALLMSYMAKALNKTADQENYEQLHKNISKAFVEAYINETDGKINGDTQTGYVVSLAFKILPQELIPKAVNNLVENIKEHDYHLTTGYVGTAFLLPVLSDHGHNDIAYKLLFQDTFPSWGYMMKNGASNIWERWDSYTEEQGFNNSSFNSLALGSVGSWLYQYMAGFSSDDEEVGFKKVIIKPYIGQGVNDIFSLHFSNYGYTKSAWRVSDNLFYIEVEIPPNTKGKLILPFKKDQWEKELNPGQYNFTVSLD